MSRSDTSLTAQRNRARSIAESLDCILDEDFQLLANVKDTTTEAWRKRRTGPSYVILGNQVLYPRQAIADFLKIKVREHVPAAVKASL